MNRRKFLKSIGIAGGTMIAASPVNASETDRVEEFTAVLIDTTQCVGCRVCEESCAEAHGLPVPDIYDESVFSEMRDTSTERWTVVNKYESGGTEIFRKSQCFQCAMPACASACLTKAMLKTKEGPVIWLADRCIGCRYCMVSCPFDIPKFEFDSPAPTIQKCDQCWDRLQEEEIPACVENCPAEALTFGKKGDLLHEAKTRIYNDRDSYYPYVYGEHEVGGTGVLFLSSVPFDEIGLRTELGNTPFPEYSKDFLFSVPIVELLWPTALYGFYKATQRGSDSEGEE